MTTTRILAGVVLAVTVAGPAAAQQFRMPQYSPPGRSSPVPSVAPAGFEDAPPPAAESLNRMTTNAVPGRPDGAPDPLATLTGQPAPGTPVGQQLPAGSYDLPGCCGPLGNNGPVGYEVYIMSGPNFVTGNAVLTDRIGTGWLTVGGGRSLFYNRAGDAAWAIDLGLSYQYNRGNQADPLDVFRRTPPIQNQTTGQSIPQPDVLTSAVIRGFHRTAFNFAIGRDWWLNGPGATGIASPWNARIGVDIGGRWGTAHVDMVPLNEVNGYFRRQGVFHGIYGTVRADVERNMGGWVWFTGLQLQYGFDWTNILPPQAGDIGNVNLLLSTGARY
jgi:hypothetical protein